MTVTITADNGAGTTSPTLVLRPDTTESYEGRSTVSDLIGGGIAITQRETRPASGQLVLLYPDRTSAIAAVQLHRQVTTFTLAEDDGTMTYAVVGRVEPKLDAQTRHRYLVTVDYQAVET